MLTDENIRRGMSPERGAPGGTDSYSGAPASLAEQHRDARGLPGLEAILQDLRFAFRLIAKDRWFSAAAIAALALGIGANAAASPSSTPRSCEACRTRTPIACWSCPGSTASGRRSNVSYSDLQDWRAASRSFDGACGAP